MTNRMLRSLALAAIAALVSTAAAAASHATCRVASRLPEAGAADRQMPQLRKGHLIDFASAKQRGRRGPRTSWQAVA
jgi:hypothetical protein